MKLAIVVTAEMNAIPAIFYGDTVADLLAQIRPLAGTPALQDEEAARAWLATLPEPSGLFLSEEEAKAHLARIRDARPADISPDDVQAVRAKLKMTRADFAEALGIGGNSNTRHKVMWEFETGKKPVSLVLARKIRSLAAENGLRSKT